MPISLKYKINYKNRAFETNSIPASKSSDIDEVTIKFGPHYYLQIFNDRNGKTQIHFGATHHGIIASANDVDDEFEKIINVIRDKFPQLREDSGIIRK